MELNKSPLHDDHVELDAKLVEFGGWEMPISYPTGTLEEHRTCRDGCVMFDVSHLGSVRVAGENAIDELQYIFTNDLLKIGQGRAQYSHLLNGRGHVVDDVIIWWLRDNLFEIMPNASNTERVESALLTRNSSLKVENVTSSRALIAVQGPKTREILRELSEDLSVVQRFHVQELEIDMGLVIVAGTGYTGEDGVEISVPSESASVLWSTLKSLGCVPAGLGARDTLRLEAGFPLHGHELGEGITPLQANLKWVVSMEKGDFIGRESIASEIEKGPKRILRGLVTNGRRPPRHGQEITFAGDVIGQVTSGNFSPTLETGIAMGFLSPKIPTGMKVVIKGERNETSAEVIKLPFYTHR